jgi:outer membrane protein assembly factor BamA
MPAATIVPDVTPSARAARVGEILIFGTEITKDRVVRRQIPFQPREILSFPDLRLAERNLASLGIFVVDPQTGVRPTVTVAPDEDSEFKTIWVQVQEAPTTGFLLGASVNSNAGLNGHLVFEERNFDITGPATWNDFRAGRAFRGGGQDLRVELSPGIQGQNYALSFREPFLFDSLYSLQADTYFHEFAYHNQYTESRLGTQVTVGRKLDRIWSFDGTVRVEDVGIRHVPFAAPPEITRDVGNHALVGLRAGLTYDTRDSRLIPTQGLLAKVAFEQFTGDFTFPKLVLGATEYWTLHQRDDGSGRQILTAHAEIGYAGAHTPVFERFYAGGLGSLRGFAFRGVGPSQLGVEVGGDFELLTSLEYQVPFLANDRLYGVAFLDSGTVERTVEIRDYRVAAGLGLRLIVPQLGSVPIAVDIGVPVLKAHGDHTQLLSFFVGVYY